MDGIELEILWCNLISIVSEQAKALQRIAFSPVVREAGDLANALFDAAAAWWRRPTPARPATSIRWPPPASTSSRPFPRRPSIPATSSSPTTRGCRPATSSTSPCMLPVFHKGRLIGYFGSTIHHTDIGGYGIGAGARDMHEEGLWIPHAQALRGRRAERGPARHHPAQRAHARPRVRRSRRAGLQRPAGGERLSALLERQGYDDIESLSDEIISPLGAGDAARRSASSRPAPVTARARSTCPAARSITLKTAVTIDTDAGEILIDFAGSSGPSPYGINVVMNYTHAYTTFAVRCCLNPELPNNYGSLAPIKVTAPEGCIVNAKYPAPVNARHVVGMYVPMPILKALYQVMPDRVLAEGSGAVWTMQIQGKHADGAPFTTSMFNYSGGMGARPTKPGPAPPAIRPASRRCRSRSWKPRCRSCSTGRSCGWAPAARARRAAATAR